MVAMNQPKGDPQLAQWCVQAYHGDNDALRQLEAVAMGQSELAQDALNLMKVANMGNPVYKGYFAEKYKDMLADLFERYKGL